MVQCKLWRKMCWKDVVGVERCVVGGGGNDGRTGARRTVIRLTVMGTSFWSRGDREVRCNGHESNCHSHCCFSFSFYPRHPVLSALSDDHGPQRQSASLVGPKVEPTSSCRLEMLSLIVLCTICDRCFRTRRN